LLAEQGFEEYGDLIEVFGASQLAEFAERYPGTASLLTVDPIQEAWVLDEWKQDARMANAFEESPEQSQLIARIRAGLQGVIKHIRILGEPGLGKTRIVLEAVKDENVAPYVLYIPHGSQFGQTRLFRQLLKSGHDRPLVLVIDELPESELSDIWRHLKPRCGKMRRSQLPVSLLAARSSWPGITSLSRSTPSPRARNSASARCEGSFCSGSEKSK
jgi:hypothetical protein